MPAELLLLFLPNYLKKFFFSIWVFFHEHPQFTVQQGKGEAVSLTPLSTASTRFTGMKKICYLGKKHCFTFRALHEFQNLHAQSKERIHEFIRGHFYGWEFFIASLILTHYVPLVFFYTPWKYQKTSCFLMFSRGGQRD